MPNLSEWAMGQNTREPFDVAFTRVDLSFAMDGVYCRVEYSPSCQATCKQCSTRIAAGALRVTSTTRYGYPDTRILTASRHLRCYYESSAAVREHKLHGLSLLKTMDQEFVKALQRGEDVAHPQEACERALKKRQRALDKRERALDERERSLIVREQALDDRGSKQTLSASDSEEEEEEEEDIARTARRGVRAR
jgi:hypothetical protein